MANLIVRIGVTLGAVLCLLMIGAIAVGTSFDRDPDSIMAHNSCALPCAFGVTPGVTDRDTAQETYGRLAVRDPLFLTARRYSYTLRLDAPSSPSRVSAVSPSRSVESVVAGRDTPAGLNEVVLALLFFQSAEGGRIEAVSLYTLSQQQQFWRLGDLMRARGVPDSVIVAYEMVAPDPGNLDSTERCDPLSPGLPSAPALLLVYDDDTLAQVNPSPRLSPDMEITRLAVTANIDATLNSLLAGYFPCTHVTPWRGFAPYRAYLP